MSRLRSTTAIAVLAVAGVLGLSAPAQAHNYLVSSNPAEGSTITELPSEFSVTTNGPLLELDGTTGFAMQVKDSAGLFYGDGCVTVSGATMAQVPALGEAGDYTVVWQVISADGHPVSGEFGFTWAPAANADVAVGTAAPPVCGVEPVTPMPTASGEATATTPTPTAVPEARPNANLSDVLWIGGAIAAALIAGLVTFVLLGRRVKG